MKLLLDTHVLIRWLTEPETLDVPVREVIGDPSNSVYISAVVFWEIAIKRSTGKFRTPGGLASSIDADETTLASAVEANNFLPLPITAAHAWGVRDLPPIHKDPFDRLLISQAILEGLHLVTADASVLRYPVATLPA